MNAATAGEDQAPVLGNLGGVACPVDVAITDDFKQRSGVVETNSGVAKLRKLSVERFLVLKTNQEVT